MFCYLIYKEPRHGQQSALAARNAAIKHPYLFLSVPHGRSGGSVVRGFEILEDDDDEDDEPKQNLQQDLEDDDEDEAENDEDDDEATNDDDDNDDEESMHDEDDDMHDNTVAIIKNAKSTQMLVPKEQAGSIMVPDGLIEIEGQSVIDEKTGQESLLVPRAALDAIPDGSVVALLERNADADSDVAEERANRVIVRRRRKGARRNVRRRGGKRGNRRRRRRRGGKRRNRKGGNRNRRRRRRRGGKRRRRYQG